LAPQPTSNDRHATQVSVVGRSSEGQSHRCTECNGTKTQALGVDGRQRKINKTRYHVRSVQPNGTIRKRRSQNIKASGPAIRKTAHIYKEHSRIMFHRSINPAQWYRIDSSVPLPRPIPMVLEQIFKISTRRPTSRQTIPMPRVDTQTTRTSLRMQTSRRREQCASRSTRPPTVVSTTRQLQTRRRRRVVAVPVAAAVVRARRARW